MKFDPSDMNEVEQILKDNSVVFEVEHYEFYNGTFVSLIWEHGTWTLPYEEVNNNCKQHAALFCYLWLKDVGLPLCDQLAYAYVDMLGE